MLPCLLLCACRVGGAAVESLQMPPVALDVAIVYPAEHAEVETDWSPRFTVQVTAAQGGAVEDARVVVSPGVIDMGGLLITPVARDFERLDAAAVEEIYREVSLEGKFVTRAIGAID